MYKPNFTITPSINNRVAGIERIKGIVDRSNILPEREIVLRYRATVDAVHSSTTIEGNPLTKREVADVLAGKLVSGPQRAIIEVQNYKKALDWVEQRGKRQREPISEKDILTLHGIAMKDLLPPGKAGSFRSGPIYIVDILKKEERLRYVGPKAKNIKQLINELTEWLTIQEKVLHPVLTAGVLHYEFVSIHPFSDGNGRTTRLLTMLFLRLERYDFRGVLVPDVYYLQNREAYYQALSRADNYQDRRIADLTPWLEYFTEGFLHVAKHLQENIMLAGTKRDDHELVRLSQQELRILDFARQVGKVTLQDATDILEVPLRTVQRRLKTLVDKGLLAKKGRGRGTYYQLV